MPNVTPLLLLLLPCGAAAAVATTTGGSDGRDDGGGGGGDGGGGGGSGAVGGGGGGGTSGHGVAGSPSDASDNLTSARAHAGAAARSTNIAEITIPLYSLIFLLSITGNSVVILTLAVNRTMRTVTNVFLLNLAVSDLLLGIVCMPVNLTGQLLKDFIFGPILCKIIPYLQSVSVSVGVWTLVGISLERYFAICRPLTSRRWQTRSHASKIIIGIWIMTLIFNVPTFIVSRLVPLKNSSMLVTLVVFEVRALIVGKCGWILLMMVSQTPTHHPARYKCREEWDSISGEVTYNLFLNAVLLMVPLIIMSCTYTLIALKLWRGMKQEKWLVKKGYIFGKIPRRWKRYSDRSALTTCGGCGGGGGQARPPSDPAGVPHSDALVEVRFREPGNGSGLAARRDHRPSLLRRTTASARTWKSRRLDIPARSTIRTSNTERSIQAKRKVIQMLFVVVLEFFICWTPLHVMNSLFIAKPQAVYHTLGTTAITLIQLLAYVSSCCNPITYCLMHRKFRSAFLETVKCGRLRRCRDPSDHSFVLQDANSAFRESVRSRQVLAPITASART